MVIVFAFVCVWCFVGILCLAGECDVNCPRQLLNCKGEDFAGAFKSPGQRAFVCSLVNKVNGARDEAEKMAASNAEAEREVC